MFVTFGTATPAHRDSVGPEAQGRDRPKAKRAQVAQACDWCRVHRVKCDSTRPCHNCLLRGGECSNSRGREVRTLPHAFREIQRLTSRVRELELELARHNAAGSDRGNSGDSASPVAASASTPPPVTTQPPMPPVPTGQEGDPHGPSADKPPRKLKLWEGIYASTTQSSPKQWYGPSSLFYFLGRMEAYMTRALQQPSTERTTWFSSAASKSLPTSPGEHGREEATARQADAANGAREDDERQGPGRKSSAAPGEYLNASQEEYFLGLFWQSHHCSLQIVDEAAFREHYRSLCLDPPPGCFRRPSALVDIMVALCMQYGSGDLGPNDGTLPGWRHYQRHRALLEFEIERPTLSTVQSLVLCVVYLCCGSFQNTAHHMLALAVRVAHTLGLHLEPPETMPRPERELRKRVWWGLYIVEIKTSMKLGRPWTTDAAQVLCSLPADDHELALRSGSNTASITTDGCTVTWLTYTRQNAKMVRAAQVVYAGFYDRCAEILGTAAGSSSSLYDDPVALDTAAEVLERYMGEPQGLRAWVSEVPAAMKTQRVGDGVPLSADLSRLDIEMFAPAWLQRQRLFLELLYHTLMINLHRPFIVFPAASVPSPPPKPGPLVMAHAMTAVRHAIALTTLLRQVIVETDLLDGWHEAFQQQWNASITMVGSVLAFPADPVASDARAAVGAAIEVFEAFGRQFSVGTSAANATRELLSKADLLRGASTGLGLAPQLEAVGKGTHHQRGGPEGDEANTAAPPGRTGLAATAVAPSTGPEVGYQPAAFLPEMTDEEAAAVRDMLADTMDMVYSADSFQPMGVPFPGGLNMAMDAWPPGFY